MRLLITGGCGFIGSNLVRLALARIPDAEIRVLDSLTYAGRPETLELNTKGDPRVELVVGDVCDTNVVDRLVAWADRIVHLAAESHVDYSAAHARVFVDTNVLGTATILEAMLRHPVERLVYISSSEVYGSAVRVPMDEEHPMLPASPYAGTKAAADRLVYSFVRAHELPAVILRPFNNYGPWQHLEKVIPRFITSAMDGQPLIIHDTGEQTRDWVFVDDTNEGIIQALTRPIHTLRGETINLGTGVETSIIDAAKKVLALTPSDRNSYRPGTRRPGQVWRHCASTAKAEQLLQWRARTSFDDGLGRTFAWYRAHEAWWRTLKPSLVPA